MTDPVAVRRASVADLDAVAPLFDAYRVFYALPSDPAAARAWLEQRMRTGTSTVLVAHRPDPDGPGGPALGFSQLYPSFCSLELAPIVVLYDLFVTPDARGAGVASALLEAAREFSEASGAARLELSTAHTNVTAQRLYEARGWRLEAEYRHYELPLR
ncbi:GNAT family N-acetyltransferase [Herbiconiux sp. VKM Ac-2851]|uniref:GNAT family N-acetyltransferase n=1 Tax=Herbiconiux sp. VKM Ac-2851 TaxID=2739025 RepID=UPI00156591A8|nr:N-acetyltransferase [Herbiconiux sp. VKM Ac-2851]NQX35186.1 GNAT family N-acetyltransferase [Herbiconiux sp. VKM Ac-2851]